MSPDVTRPWTPIAQSADLLSGTVIPARIGLRDLALWRSQSGRLAVWEDRCPHRGMRLSHGFVRGEALSCFCHGWSYGQRLRIPAHPDLEPPVAIRVPALSVTEVGGVIWAATAPSDAPPPGFDGVAPLRSLTVRAPPAALATATGVTLGSDGVMRTDLAGTACVLLVAPQGAKETVLQVPVDAGADTAARIAVSRVAEGLRRAAEALQEKEAAE